MPAKSEAQRKYLNATFGHAWVKRHHFDNKGKLPAHVGKEAAVKGKGGGKHKRSAPGKGRHLQQSGTKAKGTCSAGTYFKGTNEAHYGGKCCK